MGVGLIALALLGNSGVAAQGTTEFRGLWVDAFHSGLTNASQISQLVSDARAANFNALIIEVRKRGDAYYSGSPYEPKAAELPPEFDPLADIIQKAHDTNTGSRLEIHAWLTVYPIWHERSLLPSQTNHPFLLHKDWLTQAFDGSTFDGNDYAFDPGHPEVQKYTFAVAMDVLNRYDIDGLNLDYMHYQGPNWGYNPASVERFNRRFRREGKPAVGDELWSQFRRDQVTALLRKIYLSAMSTKPRVKISVGTITYYPAPLDDAQWRNSNPYRGVYQDWRSWMEEGILDINMPMAYFRQNNPQYAKTFRQWETFAENHRYQRQVVFCPGLYMNTVSNAFVQMRTTREPTASGVRADGLAAYSYASFSKEPVSKNVFFGALVKPSGYDPDPVPMFATPASVPEMPWKTHPSMGNLKGMLYGTGNTNALDSATIVLIGPKNRTLLSDATGFYGAVDLPTGDYSFTASCPGYQETTNKLSITAAAMTTNDITLEK